MHDIHRLCVYDDIYIYILHVCVFVCFNIIKLNISTELELS